MWCSSYPRPFWPAAIGTTGAWDATWLLRAAAEGTGTPPPAGLAPSGALPGAVTLPGVATPAPAGTPRLSTPFPEFDALVTAGTVVPHADRASTVTTGRTRCTTERRRLFGL